MNISNDIFEETGCLSEQQLRDYLQGQLSREEEHRIEMHLSSCSFCSEALEGLTEMKQPEELPAIIKQIRSRFKHQLRAHHSDHRRKKSYLWLTVIVFIIIAILLFAYYAINFTMKGEHRHQPQQLEQQDDPDI